MFSPHDVPDLYDAFGTDKFDELYEKYERVFYPKESKCKNTVYGHVKKEQKQENLYYEYRP